MKIIIIGAGLAGYQLAREFRKLDTHTAVTLITADDGRFYPKPQLSTALTQKKTAESLATASAEAMSTQLNITVLTHTTVTQLDPIKKHLFINEEILPYDKLVLACGAEVITAPLSGEASRDVLSINHLYHYSAFEKYIQNKKHITILGAGLIGCEFANDLSNVGYQVSVIAPDTTPLEKLLPPTLGTLLQATLEKQGVTFHLKTTAQSVEKEGTHYAVTLANGKKLLTDFVLSAIGLKPKIDLAKGTPLQTDRGFLVNHFLETNVKDVFALGDCAEVNGHVLPFITPILQGARALAKTLAGQPCKVLYPAMPVTIKTPAHPIVVCPPPTKIKGHWELDIQPHLARAFFYDEDKQLRGFVLTQEATKERLQWMNQIPDLF